MPTNIKHKLHLNSKLFKYIKHLYLIVVAAETKVTI